MKHFYLDEHRWFCDTKINNGSIRKSYCELNPEHFLFFVGNEFILITYHKCMEGGDGYNFKKELIEQVIEKFKIFPRYEVNRGVDVEKNLKNFRLRNIPLRKFIKQVNFIYSDATGKEYAITTLIEYLDSICNEDAIRKNYKEATEYLSNYKYDSLLDELYSLYSANSFGNINDAAECHKTTEHIIKSIRQLIKQ